MEVGVDYFGPFDVTIGRRREKRYGALFTCMTTRAVHIEVAASLTTDSAIMAIRRMIARRGNPRSIVSDNGTNFHGADNELRKAFEAMDKDKIIDTMAQVGIEWKFNPPSAPHMGGAWESLVKSIKTALHSTLKDRAPKDEVVSGNFLFGLVTSHLSFFASAVFCSRKQLKILLVAVNLVP
jgi:transposase InsO family protein